MSVARPPRKKVTVMERVLSWEQAYRAVLTVLTGQEALGEPYDWYKIEAGKIAADLIKGTEEAG